MKQKKVFIVRGMDCASCALIVEKALKEIPELTSVNVNYATERRWLKVIWRLMAEKL